MAVDLSFVSRCASLGNGPDGTALCSFMAIHWLAMRWATISLPSGWIAFGVPFIRIDGDGHAKILVRRNDGIAEYAQLSIAHDGVVDVAVTVVSG